MDFPTKSALVLSTVTVGGLLLLSAISNSVLPMPSVEVQHEQYHAHHAYYPRRRRWLEEGNSDSDIDYDIDSNRNSSSISNDENDYSKYSCHFIYEITPNAGDAQCAFATTCNQGEGVWAPFVFCSNRFSMLFLCAMLAPFMFFWLVLLFRLLSSTAEDYFSPALEMFSVRLGLPAHFAGVTLLALGNSAADVSASISAITSDPVSGYKMSLGAITGAAMVSSGVMSAAVVLAAATVNNGVIPCRGALVRDVTTLMVAVATVWHQLASGTIGPKSIKLFLALYIIFVLLVLATDVYNAVVLPRLQAVGVGAGCDDVELQCQSLEANIEIPSSSEDDDVDADKEALQLIHGGVVSLERRQNGVALSLIEQDPVHAYAVLSPNAVETEIENEGTHADNWSDALLDGRDELVQHVANIWDDIMYNDNVHPVSKFLLLCELPFTCLRQVTVPVPCEEYYCRALVALSLAVSPLWFFYYLWDVHGLNILAPDRKPFAIGFELVVCASALCILRFAPDGSKRDMALVFSSPIALYGFVIAATWIDTISDALVDVLNFVGIIFRIPGPVIGLTILAWGNSVSDLTANMATARRGLANMAITACFAEPIFNILVGLGLGFSYLAMESGQVQTEVSLSSSVVTGFVFIALNAVALLGTCLCFGKGHIPKEFGYLALAIYTIYLVASISIQYSKYADSA